MKFSTNLKFDQVLKIEVQNPLTAHSNKRKEYISSTEKGSRKVWEKQGEKEMIFFYPLPPTNSMIVLSCEHSH